MCVGQSFEDFEFIIIDDGSTDHTLSIVRSYKDQRIRLLKNKHDFIASLNLGVHNANGKYIARMDSDDIMHRDRLKIQYEKMEEDPKLTVCTSRVKSFRENISENSIVQSRVGILEHPLLYLLEYNFLFHPSAMIRSTFLRQYHLKYEHYQSAEDYKLWIEIIKCGGIFYVEPIPLLYYRLSINQVNYKKKEEQYNTSLCIQKEILDTLLELNSKEHLYLSLIREGMEHAEMDGLLTSRDISMYFYKLFLRNMKIFILK